MDRNERYQRITPSEHDHEADVIDYLFGELPDRHPFRGWSNFTFIDGYGNPHEVDALLVTPAGVFLTEIKSYYGDTAFSDTTWMRSIDGGRSDAEQSPYALAHKKAQFFKSLLTKSQAFRRAKAPYVSALIVYSPTNSGARLRTMNGPVNNLLIHDDFASAEDHLPGVIASLSSYDAAPDSLKRSWQPVNKELAKRVALAMEEFQGENNRTIVNSMGWTRVGEYEAGDTLESTALYEDVLAVSAKKQVSGHYEQVRVRFYHPGKNHLSLPAAQTARDREYHVLKQLTHQNILPAIKSLDKHKRGPVLILQHGDRRQTLSQWLVGESTERNQDPTPPSFELRARVFLQVLDAVQFAHSKRIFHRALRPQSVLVDSDNSDAPHALVFNWMTAEDEEAPTEAATQHVHRWVEELSRIYLPLAYEQSEQHPEVADIFSLGMLGIFLFAGREPCGSVTERDQLLRDNDGIHAADVSDAIPIALDEVFFRATQLQPGSRFASVSELREAFESAMRKPSDAEADDQVSVPARSSADIPVTELQAGDTLGPEDSPQRFRVVSVLGKGSTARAYRVSDSCAADKRHNLVLKVALDPEFNDRIAEEAATLRKLSDLRGVIELHEDLIIRDHRVLVLEDANDTLRTVIQSDSKPTLERLEGVGRVLFDILDSLERKQQLHRDLKPDNIGFVVDKVGGVELKLFDFSLAEAADDELEIGTTRYRDPMLKPAGQSGDNRLRWDMHAERWAAALTLYEYATHGHLPRWKGDCDPTIRASEAQLDLSPGLFPSSNRDRVVAFFRKAFRLPTEARFQTAEEMARAWRDLFEGTKDTVTTTSDELVRALRDSVPGRSLSALPLTEDLSNVLEQRGFVTVADLLDDRFYQLADDSVALKKQLGAEKHDQFLRLIDAVKGYKFERTTSQPKSKRDYSQMSIPDLAENLWGSEVIDPKDKLWGQRLLVPKKKLLGHALHPSVFDHRWRADTDSIADWSGSDRLERVTMEAKLGGDWKRKSMIHPLRDDLKKRVEEYGGLRGFRSVVWAIRAQRGAQTEIDEADLMIRAVGVCRAGVAGEESRSEGSQDFVRIDAGAGHFLISANRFDEDEIEAFTRWLNLLGRRADALVEPGVPVSRQTACAALRSEATESDTVSGFERGLRDQLLLELAAEASSGAALSTRHELYPHNMPAVTVLRHMYFPLIQRSQLSGEELKRFDESQLRQLASRQFPMAALLPDGHQRLTDLLDQAGLRFEESAGSTSTSGRYLLPPSSAGTSIGTSLGTSYANRTAPAESTWVDVRRKLENRREQGGAIVLECASVPVEAFADMLAEEFDLAPVDLEQVVFDALAAETRSRMAGDEAKVSNVWNSYVLKGDYQSSPGFKQIMGSLHPRVKQQLEKLGERVVLYRTGVFHEFGFTTLLDELVRTVGHPHSSRVVWVLESKRPSGLAVRGVGHTKEIPREKVRRGVLNDRQTSL